MRKIDQKETGRGLVPGIRVSDTPALEPALTDFFPGPHERLSFVIEARMKASMRSCSWLDGGERSAAERLALSYAINKAVIEVE